MEAPLQKEVFDLARTVIERLSSWPVAVLVVILLFKTPLGAVLKSVSAAFGRMAESLLSRGFKVGLNKEGFKLEAEAATAVTAQEKIQPVAAGLVDIEGQKPSEAVKVESTIVATGSADDAETRRLQAVKNINVPPIALEQESLIRADLTKLGMNEHEQVELLVKHLAVTQLWLRAEHTYRTIFGSQIALLKFLNTTGGGTRAQVLQFYESAKARFPELYGTYSSEQYLHYLLSQHLIIAQDPERYLITVAGREFLKWMADTGVGENKPF